MKVLVVYAHPNPASFNRAILDALLEGLRGAEHDIRVNDLYAEGFNPILDRVDLELANRGVVPEQIATQQRSIMWAEALVFIYPLWWFDRPAILKGWFDRVFTNGFAFKYTASGMQGLLPQRKALVIVTVGGEPSEYKQINFAEHLVRPTTDGTLALCGVRHIEDKVFYAVPTVSDEERRAMLDEVRRLGLSF
jgi:NAD(P)H dehydrogenase (quinone)